MKFSHLPRVYTSGPISKNQIIRIDGDNFRYLKTVIRLRRHDNFRLFNDQDGEYLVRIEEIDKNQIIIEVVDIIRNITAEPKLILAISIIKNDRMIEAIKAAVQIGVTSIIPVISSRTQIKTVNKDKLNRCVIESIEQCERFVRPILYDPLTLEQLCKMDEQIIFANESEHEIKKLSNITISKNPIFLVGPEGGFTESEIEMLNSIEKVNSISLGSNVLRTEVASIAGLACIQMIRK